MASVRSLSETERALMEMTVVMIFSESAAESRHRRKLPGSLTAYLLQRKLPKAELSSLCQIRQSKRA